MRHRLTALLLLLSAPAQAAGVDLIEAGLHCVSPRTETTRPAPDTVEGIVHEMIGAPYDVLGRTVPLVPGLSFGIRVRSDRDRAVRMVTLHPPLGPDAGTRSAWDSRLAAGRAHMRGFTFDHAYEMVPGTWTMEVHEGDDVLLSVAFEVVDGPVAAVDAACGTMLS